MGMIIVLIILFAGMTFSIILGAIISVDGIQSFYNMFDRSPDASLDDCKSNDDKIHE